MRLSKCKNSVFCIYFFIFFVLGTICGVFCCRLVVGSEAIVMRSYYQAISSSLFENTYMAVITTLCHFVAVFVFSVCPGSHKFIFLYIAVRSFMISYTAAALWIGECDFCLIILRGLIILPALYWTCRWSYYYADGK